MRSRVTQSRWTTTKSVHYGHSWQQMVSRRSERSRVALTISRVDEEKLVVNHTFIVFFLLYLDNRHPRIINVSFLSQFVSSGWLDRPLGNNKDGTQCAAAAADAAAAAVTVASCADPYEGKWDERCNQERGIARGWQYVVWETVHLRRNVQNGA